MAQWPDLVPAAPPLHLRQARPTDAEFLRRLAIDCRPEWGLLPSELVDLQLAAQQAQYRSDHPQSVDEIIELGEQAVGRCWTACDKRGLHLLDLAVQTGFRRRGIASGVLARLAERAAARDVDVHLAVWQGNTAARILYAAAGFVETGAAGGYLVMRHAAGRQS